MKYKDGLKHVLHGVKFEAKSLERIAIVGRTGAGKSSIIQALFRMSEIDTRTPDGGSSNSSSNHRSSGQPSRIFYDGIDTKEVQLQRLRRSIGIIPQTPFVFSGSIRRNIDPLQEHSDEEIYRVLNATGLNNLVS